MINLKVGETYGLRDEKELMETINTLRDMNMSDEDINKILINSESRKQVVDIKDPKNTLHYIAFRELAENFDEVELSIVANILARKRKLEL